VARYRAYLDSHRVLGEVLQDVLDGTMPDETQVIVSRPHSTTRDQWSHVKAGTMHVQLDRPEPEGHPAVWMVDDLSTHDIAVEADGAIPSETAMTT